MQDYSDTCPWTYLAECVEADMFPQELLDKLKEENHELLISNTALQIVKDENEVNKKNMFKFMKQNKELEEENKKLKQFALNVHNFAYGTKWDDEDIVSAMDFEGIIEKMKKDEEVEYIENKIIVNDEGNYEVVEQ